MTSRFSFPRRLVAGYRSSAAALMLLLLATIPMQLVEACPGCSAVTAEIRRSEPETIMAGFAFSWSVLFMLVVSSSIIGFLTMYIAKTVQRIDRERSRE
jgi:hypothetical protein